MKTLSVQSTACLLIILHLGAFAVGCAAGWGVGLAAFLVLHLVLLGITLRVRSKVFGGAVEFVNADGNSVCLTIDDGPCGDTREILDLLDSQDAKAVFFLIGERAAERPDDVLEILRRGHRIGNHTQTHPAKWFWFYGPKKQRHEIQSCQETLTAITGRTPILFRAPAGFRNPFTGPVSRGLGLQTWGWHARGFDATSSNVPRIIRLLTGNLKPGAILLIHQGRPHHPEVLRRLLETLKSNKFTCRLPDN